MPRYTFLLLLLSFRLLASVDPGCLELLSARVRDPGVIPGMSIAFDEEGVVYDPAGVEAGHPQLQRYERIHAEPISGFDSARLLPIVEGSPRRFNVKNGKGHIVLLHGHMGFGHSGSWLKVIPTLAQSARVKNRGAGREVPLAALLKDKSWYTSFPLGVEAIDGPLHGSGPSDVERFSNIEQTIEWYASYLEKTSNELRAIGQPMYVMARSSMVPILLAALSYQPDRLRDRINRMIFLGAFHPKVGYEQAIQLAAQGIPAHRRNSRSENWITQDIIPQMIAPGSPYDWTRNSSPFMGIPTLAMFGEEDNEMPPAMLQAFRDIVKSEQGVQRLTKMVSISGAGHDPLKPEPATVALVAWEEVYKFLASP